MKGDFAAADSSADLSLSDSDDKNDSLGETTVENQETTENIETANEELKDAGFSTLYGADPYQPPYVISPSLNLCKAVMSNA